MKETTRHLKTLRIFYLAKVSVSKVKGTNHKNKC